MTERADFYMTIDGRVERLIARAAKERNVKPADLVERLIETIFEDNLVDAIMDDRE